MFKTGYPNFIKNLFFFQLQFPNRMLFESPVEQEALKVQLHVWFTSFCKKNKKWEIKFWDH